MTPEQKIKALIEAGDKAAAMEAKMRALPLPVTTKQSPITCTSAHRKMLLPPTPATQSSCWPRLLRRRA